MAATVFLVSVWLVFFGELKPHSDDQLARSIVSEIRADVLLEDEHQIDVKLTQVQEKYGLAHLSFKRTHPGGDPYANKSDWQLAVNNGLPTSVYPVEVGGRLYGWLNFSGPTKAQYGLIFFSALLIALFVFNLQPKLFPRPSFFPNHAPPEDDAWKTPTLLTLTKGSDGHQLSVHYTAFRSVRDGDIQMLCPSIQSWCVGFSACLSIRELATLALGNHLYRPAYKWLLVRALREMGEQGGLNEGRRLLLPITGSQLIDREFFDELKTLMLIEDIEPSRVIIEIHESLVGQHTRDNLSSGLNRFAAYGFGICVDGFGSTDKCEHMLSAGPITHVRWCIEPQPEGMATDRTEQGQALALLAQQFGVRVMGSGFIDPGSKHPLANMVSCYSHERPLNLSSDLQAALHRQLLTVTYQDVYRHAV